MSGAHVATVMLLRSPGAWRQHEYDDEDQLSLDDGPGGTGGTGGAAEKGRHEGHHIDLLLGLGGRPSSSKDAVAAVPLLEYLCLHAVPLAPSVRPLIH